MAPSPVNFYNGDVLLGAGTLSTGNTYTLAWYGLSAVARDNEQFVGNGASTVLTVLPNAAPTVGAVQVPTSTVTLGNTVTLSVGTITSAIMVASCKRQ